MTAQPQPRHPLALLADYLEARQVYEEAFDVDPLPSENHIEDAAARFVIAEQALHAIDPAALRAQAEAEAGLREALNRIACAWTITANSLYVNGGTEFGAGKAAGLAQASESLTRTCAALAQAGGES